MDRFQIILGFVVAAALAFMLARQYRRESAKRGDQGRVLFEPVLSLFEEPLVQRAATAGVWTLTGRYRDHQFQLKTVADTLATRKLPSLWLMITLPEPLPIAATTNMMMRAAGVTSFSNFDFLPHTLELLAGFPEQATLRSDVSSSEEILQLMTHHLDIFHSRRGKEFLISPKGLRIVVQLAESDRARYGVFREANFGDASIDVDVATQVMDTLINLRNDIFEHAKT
jgi:hypothetical protein